MNQLSKQFTFVGICEGISYLLLLGIAMPLKYLMGWPLAVKYVGWAHGVLFVAYIVLSLAMFAKYKWSVLKLGLAFLAAFLPFGPFVFDRKILPNNRI